jgi:hypothetical protein
MKAAIEPLVGKSTNPNDIIMKKKKQNWQNGDIFLIPLTNNSYGVGQVLDLMMPNVLRVALFKNLIEKIDSSTEIKLNYENLISLVACTREQIDYHVWIVVGNASISITKKNYPNEEYRKSNYVGAKFYDAALVESFLNAFHCLILWDDWFNPNYLDKFLIDITLKPKNILLKSDSK